MTNVFLYGTLCHVPLLELVLGRDVRSDDVQPAVAPGHRVVRAEGREFPLIEAATGSEAQGVLLRDLSEADLARLDFYELGFGYDLIDLVVRVGAQEIGARVYVPPAGVWQGGAAWSLEDWLREWWPITRHSAAEVMSYFGRLSGEEVARRVGMILTRATAKRAAETDDTPVGLRGGLTAEQVDLIDTNRSHAGFFLLNVLELRHPRFDGEMSEKMFREVFVAGDAAILLPYDPVRDVVLLTEQFRMGPFARGDQHPWVLEPVAGRIDGGETPHMAAEREAEEEAGVTLKAIEPIANYYPSPGYSTEYFYTYLGIADLPDSVAGIGGVADEHEDIRTHVIPFEAAMELVESGEANNGPLILSLLWLARNRPRLRAGI
ncbi:MAG: tellurium resistance protein [Rhodobacterales bacterium]|nr:MAG: tellurium resistance protein [Rhodobacterales bacterium]